MELSHIDHGRPFDWGRASADYARWRDIYPPEFFRPLTERKTEKTPEGRGSYEPRPSGMYGGWMDRRI